MGSSVQHRFAFWHAHCSGRAMASYPAATCLRRQLVWISSSSSLGASCKDNPRPPSDSSSILVYEKRFHRSARRFSTVHGHLRGVTLRVQEFVARQKRLLLRLRLPQRCLHRAHGYCRRSHSCGYLRSSLRRGKSPSNDTLEVQSLS